MTDRPRIILEGKSLGEYFEQTIENKKLKDKLYAKEQECEKLKEEVSLLKESNSKLQQMEDGKSIEKFYLQQLDQLKSENEELKKYIKHLHNLCGNETDKQYELKQTLTEIKEVCNSVWGNGLDEEVDKFDLILQKIREVEE